MSSTNYPVVDFPTNLDLVYRGGVSVSDLGMRLQDVAALMDHARDLILEHARMDNQCSNIGSQRLCDLVPSILQGALALIRTTEPALDVLASKGTVEASTSASNGAGLSQAA